MTEPVRVVVVDDHSMFRAGVREALSGAADVVGQAGDVDEAVAVIDETSPEVVLLDVHLPGGAGGGGAEVIERVRAGRTATLAATALPAAPLPEVRFLALSVSDSAEDVGRVIRAGAHCYVTKTISAEDLRGALAQVRAGYAVFSPRLAGFVLDAFGAGREDIAATDDELDRLTAREQEVMRLIARGYTYREVGQELFISVKTVETHVSSVLRKLQLSSRNELTRWAAQRRIV